MKRILAIAVTSALAFAAPAMAASEPPQFIPRGQVQSTLGDTPADATFSFTLTLQQSTPCAFQVPGDGIITDDFERTVVLAGPVTYTARTNPNGVVTGYEFVSWDASPISVGRICLGGWLPTGPSVNLSAEGVLTANGVVLEKYSD
jgi:hypothetical protein